MMKMYTMLLTCLCIIPLPMQGSVKREANGIAIELGDFVTNSNEPVIIFYDKKMNAQELLTYPHMIQPLSITIHNKTDKPIMLSNASLDGVQLISQDKLKTITDRFSLKFTPDLMPLYIVLIATCAVLETSAARYPAMTLCCLAWSLFDMHMSWRHYLRKRQECITPIESLLMPVAQPIIIQPGSKVRRTALVESAMYWGRCTITLFDETGTVTRAHWRFDLVHDKEV